MRPVDRGEWPTHPGSEIPVAFEEYGEAKPHLGDRLGHDCSYCELRIPNQAALEHVLPKSPRHSPELERTWCNFLLSCVWCNSIKAACQRIELTAYFWPDRDDTMRARSYGEGGVIGTATGLAPVNEARARRTIELTGLDRDPSSQPKTSARDRRWQHRREAWEPACEMRGDLLGDDTERMRSYSAKLALKTGFWSVWMTVFSGDPDMRGRLIGAFPGTSRACFDDRTRPVARPTGAL